MNHRCVVIVAVSADGEKEDECVWTVFVLKECTREMSQNHNNKDGVGTVRSEMIHPSIVLTGTEASPGTRDDLEPDPAVTGPSQGKSPASIHTQKLEF